MDPTRITDLLRSWIASSVEAESLAWLDEKRRQVADGAPEWVFFTSFSAVPRYTGKADLSLTPEALREADEARPGWRPVGWSADQAGRTLLVLALPHEDPDAYVETLDKVFTTADVAESVALYQSLPLLPLAEHHRGRAAEGIRSNMAPVFNAVALRNPYPAEYFEEGAWNQMVLKAVFVGSPLHLIQGLDRRANSTLARMLVDFAHERWAAGRPVTPELWRPVGFFVDPAFLPDLARVLEGEDPIAQEAAALALAQSPLPGAQEALARRPDLQNRIREGALTWESLRGDSGF